MEPSFRVTHGALSADVPLTSANFVALARTVWASRAGDPSVLVSAVSPIDRGVALVAGTHQEALRTAREAATVQPTQALSALLHQVSATASSAP